MRTPAQSRFSTWHRKGKPLKTADMLYNDETRAIIGCVYDVFNSMPRFAGEALYLEAMEIALEDIGIPFEAQKEIHPAFHGRNLTHTYRPDIICFGRIVVELKAVDRLLPEHYGQLRNYMGLLGMRVGLLVNFHATPVVEIRRLYLRNMDQKGEVSSPEVQAEVEAECEVLADGGRREAAIRPARRSTIPLPPPGNRPPSSGRKAQSVSDITP